MPFVNVKVLKGRLDGSMKRKLQTRLTDAVADVIAEGNTNFRKNITVLIQEYEPEQWSTGGVNAVDIIAQMAAERSK